MSNKRPVQQESRKVADPSFKQSLQAPITALHKA